MECLHTDCLLLLFVTLNTSDSDNSIWFTKHVSETLIETKYWATKKESADWGGDEE